MKSTLCCASERKANMTTQEDWKQNFWYPLTGYEMQEESAHTNDYILKSCNPFLH